ncbi:hypothetical protein BRADI_3g31913v3 [Brachypodium distachyon]|uniref:Uncharacterized protein n=1 Tax=Brachypodium distachyon TaxID=15368 RepID=A0A0Q3FD42_BRADI|nr:hypothetical protein BRADI_3g31913v3 [Brachypodium distachyon]
MSGATSFSLDPLSFLFFSHPLIFFCLELGILLAVVAEFAAPARRPRHRWGAGASHLCLATSSAPPSPPAPSRSHAQSRLASQGAAEMPNQRPCSGAYSAHPSNGSSQSPALLHAPLAVSSAYVPPQPPYVGDTQTLDSPTAT